MKRRRPSRTIGVSAPRAVKILGERNSGTTYLERLLRRNLRISSLPGVVPKPVARLFPASERVRDLYFRVTKRHNLGWKHAMAPLPGDLAKTAIDRSGILFLTLTKNPYSWLLSLYDHPYHAPDPPRDFEAFLETPWPTVGRENARACFDTPMDLWNEKTASYLALAAHAVVLTCRYEDLIANPFGILTRLVREHGIGVLRAPFENVEETTKREDRGRNFSDYRDYYLEERWRQRLSSSTIASINARLDETLMKRLGYARIDPAEAERSLDSPRPA